MAWSPMDSWKRELTANGWSGMGRCSTGGRQGRSSGAVIRGDRQGVSRLRSSDGSARGVASPRFRSGEGPRRRAVALHHREERPCEQVGVAVRDLPCELGRIGSGSDRGRSGLPYRGRRVR
ncbi:hypothetical protein GCM10010507_19250 [Streptomyces cinnamoneus]|uniref:Uncharacterized protein n=1 Tax=Streptomyces cinnamoneus TaxID=53446 RepID=A0A918WHG5_STRCJ|nr:hypothetical protein GCM10010507_19250 [Streptomyces cinnamoneus]